MAKIPKFITYIQELGEGSKRTIKLIRYPNAVTAVWDTELNIDGEIKTFHDYWTFRKSQQHPTIASLLAEAKRKYGIREDQLIED